MDEYIAVFADMYGISEDDRGKAERCIESTIEYIKNYCHIDGIPDDLKHTVILLWRRTCSAMIYRHHRDDTTM